MSKICPGPVPDTRKPDLVLPAGAIDTHMHIIGSKLKYAFVEDRSYTPPEASVRDYRQMRDTIGVERCVIVTPSVYGTDNSVTLDAMAELGPGLARGVAVIDDKVPDRELEVMDAAGVRGVRFNMHTGGTAIEQLERVVEMIAPMGWHVQLFCLAARIAELQGRLSTLKVPLMVDHAGMPDPAAGLNQPGFAALLELVRQGNTWVKLSAPERSSREDRGYDDAVPFYRALIEAGPGRMVWGSDWPHVIFFRKPVPNDGDLVDMLSKYGLDEAALKAILVDTPAAFYGFD